MNERLENEKISTLLISLAIPSILAQLTTLIYNLVDRIYIGRLPNSSLAIAGIGLCTSIITIITAVTNLFGRGGAPLASIRLGEKNTEEAQKILGNCFKSLMITSVIIIVILNLFGTQILMLFGASENTLDYALQYLRIYSWGTIFAQLSVGLNYFINAQGFAKYGMFTLLLGGILNIILDPVFIFLFDMGVAGAAVATVISQFVSCLWVLGFFFGKKTMLRLTKKSLEYDLNVMKRVFGLGLSPFFMSSTEGILQVSFNRQLLFYGGDIAVSAMTIMMSMSQILSLPMEGIAQATQPIISYNYGANQKDRMNQTLKMSTLTIGFILLLGTCLFFIFPSPILQLFNANQDMLAIGTNGLRILSFSFIFSTFAIVMSGVFESLGKGPISLIITLTRQFIIIIPLSFILLPLLGLNGIWLTFPLSELIATFIAFVLYQKVYKHMKTGNENF